MRERFGGESGGGVLKRLRERQRKGKGAEGDSKQQGGTKEAEKGEVKQQQQQQQEVKTGEAQQIITQPPNLVDGKKK